MARTLKPRIGCWPDNPLNRELGLRGWFAAFPDTPAQYTVCDSWRDALDCVREWYAEQPQKGTDA